MAFPIVRDSSAWVGTTGYTTAYDLPADYEAGDLLLLFVVSGSTSGYPYTNATGWTALEDGFTYTQGAIFYKIATGSEGTTVTLDNDGAHPALDTIGVCLAIRQTQGAPENSALIQYLDPSSLTASWGAADSLWIAFGRVGTDGTSITAAPTGYSGLSAHASAKNAGAIAFKTLNTDTENADAFTADGAVSDSGSTLVVIRGADSEGNLFFGSNF